MSRVSMVKEKGGQESTDKVEVWRDDNLASSFPEPNKEGNMTEVEMGVDVPQGNETDSKDNVEEDNAGSNVHGSDGNLASSLSEAEEEETMMEKGGDSAGSEVQKKNSREKSDIGEAYGSDSA
eukprot:6099329-Ditylum_brightwellii.AAC.1